MAKAKSKKPSGKTEAENAKPEETVEAVIDAVVDGVEGDPESIEALSEAPADEAAQDQEAEAPEETAAEVTDEPRPEADTAEHPDGADSEDTAPADAEPDAIDEMLAEPEPSPEPAVVQEKIVERKGGFVPMALGGVIAAAIGFGAAQVTDIDLFGSDAPNPFEQEARMAFEAQGDQIATLETAVDEAKTAIGIIDLDPVMNSVAGVEDSLSGLSGGIAALETEVAGLAGRVTALEKAPVADAVGPEAIAAYERELEELRLAITAQKQAVDEQKAEIMAMAEEAMAANASAEENATLAASRSAMAELIALAQSGKAFAGPLAVLTDNGVEVPDALSAMAAEGVPTVTALATDFPDLARAALSEARRNAPKDEEAGGGFANFLSNQLGARSTVPREGDDPDAVLSRAEAAVKTGDLDSALGEIQALPEVSQAVLADWVARAAARNDALAAAQSLAQDLNNE